MAELKLSILAGADSKKFLEALSTELDRMELLLKKLEACTGASTTKEEDDESEPVSKKAKAKSKSFEEDDEEETGTAGEEEDSEDFDDEEEPATTKKKGRKKAVTRDEVNDACKARASNGRRPEVLAILKKKFKVESISELEPDQYAEVMEAMKEDE